MDEFFKRLSKHESILKNYEDITAAGTAPVPSSTPDGEEQTQKFDPTLEHASPDKVDDKANTPDAAVHIVGAMKGENDEYSYGFYTPKQEESQEQKGPTSNDLIDMLEQAGENTDFLS